MLRYLLFICACCIACSPRVPKDAAAEQGFDRLPQYPGGEAALSAFLKANLKYPESAKKAGLAGTVKIRFLVKRNGFLAQPRILQSLGSGCDAEALRLVADMPNWEPAVKNGEPRSAWVYLDVVFQRQ